MINLKEIKNFYPETLQGFDKFILREYLQYKILEIIFNSEYAGKLCFLGGTCLRIVHNNSRFSEDLDFDNFNLTREDFKEISIYIKSKLMLQGLIVEIRNVMAGAFHCYIKFPNVLFDMGLSGHHEEKILIQIDTEPQNFRYEPENFILNKFDVFTSIKTTPIDLLLSQKMYALINRKRKKGRDFFDVIFLFKSTYPNMEYLELKLGIKNRTELKEQLLKSTAEINLKEMADDVLPFLFSPSDAGRIVSFDDYISQVL